jgi:SAM-dependent methyltransferase
MIDPYEGLATRFIAHYDTLRGAIRETLVADQLSRHLPTLPARVVDVGGGAGQQAIRLARAGFEVVLVEPSQEMRARAQQAIDAENRLSTKVRVVGCYGEDAPEVLGGETFDVVCCHGVLPYLDDPTALVLALGRLGAPGGILSLVVKNRDALAFRPALERRWSEALAAFQADGDIAVSVSGRVLTG